jgi:putative tryptophan/tyrosine transport system substrate-binding protein
MRRREFTALIGASAVWPLAAHAQQGMPVIGSLHASTASGVWLKRDSAFRQALGEVGYTEGRNLTIEARWAGEQYDRLPAMAADLTQRDVALIAAFTTPAARAAKAATAKIPIVFTTISNPVQIGLVTSLNRPGGNLTGVSLLSVEIAPKLLELLRTAIPSATIMAMLINPANPNAETQLRNTQEAARKLGLELHVLNANTERDLDVAFDKLHELRASALVIGQDVFFNTYAAQIAARSIRAAMPTIYGDREFAEAGGLMSYGTDQLDTFRQVGVYAGRILKGEKPADLPVIQASKFELLINLKTARTLGLTLSPDVLSIANEVIE